MLDLLMDKELRKNYFEILRLQTHEEINTFISSLSEKDRDKLFCFTDSYAIKARRKRGMPLREYFLVHYDEFVPEEEKLINARVTRHLNIIYGICALTLIIVLIIM